MIEELLTQLRMIGALNFFQSQKEDNLTKEQLIIALLKNEIDWKSSSRLKRRLKLAKFPFEREWSHIDTQVNPKTPFKRIMGLSNGSFIKNKRNICFIGAPGLGKTHSVVSIGRDLCRHGHTVKFYTAIDLVNHLEEAKENHRLIKLMSNLLKPQLLIIDELGFVPFSNNGARLLFDVFSKRYENGSTAVTTNLSFPKWTETFGSIELTTALVDRFTHRCEIFSFEGESYRFIEGKKSRSSKNKEASNK